MRKIEFIWNESYGNDVKEIFEFENEISNDEIQSEYDSWIGELIGDRMGWCDIEE